MFSLIRDRQPVKQPAPRLPITLCNFKHWKQALPTPDLLKQHGPSDGLYTAELTFLKQPDVVFERPHQSTETPEQLINSTGSDQTLITPEEAEPWGVTSSFSSAGRKTINKITFPPEVKRILSSRNCFQNCKDYFCLLSFLFSHRVENWSQKKSKKLQFLQLTTWGRLHKQRDQIRSWINFTAELKIWTAWWSHTLIFITAVQGLVT